jgi:hypothetical protein
MTYRIIWDTNSLSCRWRYGRGRLDIDMRYFFVNSELLFNNVLYSLGSWYLRTKMFDRCSHLYRKKLAQSFIFTFRYIDIRSLHNSKFGDFVDRIYPIELEIKDTLDTHKC